MKRQHRLEIIANTMEAYALLVQRAGLDLRVTYPEKGVTSTGKGSGERGRIKKLQEQVKDLERRVAELERAASSHRLAGYD